MDRQTFNILVSGVQKQFRQAALSLHTTKWWCATFVSLRHLIFELLRQHVVNQMSKHLCCLHILRGK